ncbi:MAG: helix-turn-helix domain-containing protein [Candidatus Fimenecus sp.]
MRNDAETNPQWIIGSRIMQRRKQFGMKQKELAEQVGLTDNQISNIENGISYPRMGNFLKICDVLKASPDYFIMGTIRHGLTEDILDMLTLCSPAELETIWLLLDTYIHRGDKKEFEK